MPVGEYDYNATQGNVFDRLVHWQTQATPTSPLFDVDLTGWSLHMQVREDFAERDVVVVCDLTEANGRVGWVDQSGGWFFVHLDASDVEAIPIGDYIYDIELIPPSGPTGAVRLLAGRFAVAGDVTR